MRNSLLFPKHIISGSNCSFLALLLKSTIFPRYVETKVCFLCDLGVLRDERKRPRKKKEGEREAVLLWLCMNAYCRYQMISSPHIFLDILPKCMKIRIFSQKSSDF
jgi:hypothetical protein